MSRKQTRDLTTLPAITPRLFDSLSEDEKTDLTVYLHLLRNWEGGGVILPFAVFVSDLMHVYAGRGVLEADIQRALRDFRENFNSQRELAQAFEREYSDVSSEEGEADAA